MRPDAPVLGFDTSAAHCAAGLFLGDRSVARFLAMQRGQAESLFPMLEELLSAEGLVWRDLSAIGVGVGPGNFTGIRISVSAARGLALGLAIPAIGVSSFEVLAEDRPPGPLIVSLPAPRGQSYVQVFDGPGPVAAPEMAAGDALPGCLASLHRPGILGYRAQDLARRLGQASDVAEALPDAATLGVAVARIAARKLRSGAVQPRPAPLYVRPADAAPMRDAPPVILS